MKHETPEQHTHYTLENIKAECEADPHGLVNKALAHKLAFLAEKRIDRLVNSTKPTENYARWAMWAAIVAAAAGIA